VFLPLAGDDVRDYVIPKIRDAPGIIDVQLFHVLDDTHILSEIDLRTGRFCDDFIKIMT
jgi:hypothetical protein